MDQPDRNRGKACAGLDERSAHNRLRDGVPAPGRFFMTPLTTHLAGDGDACVLVIDGEVDCANAERVSTAGIAALENPTVRCLTIDLGGVSFCDAAGLGALVQIRNAALLREKALGVGPLSNPVAKLLRITQLETVFTIYPTDP